MITAAGYSKAPCPGRLSHKILGYNRKGAVLEAIRAKCRARVITHLPSSRFTNPQALGKGTGCHITFQLRLALLF
jgi:hypothetical protein